MNSLFIELKKLSMATNLTMLPIRQKKITDAIRKAGFQPKEFAFKPISNNAFDISFKSIPEFRMKAQNLASGGMQIIVSPGSNSNLSESFKHIGFQGQLRELENWLTRVMENIEIGNPWEEIQEFKDDVFGNDFDSYEEMLSDDSVKMLDAKLTMLLEYFETKEIDVTEIKEDIAFLKKESKKASKRSLRNQFIGIVCSWFFTGLIPPDVVPDALAYVKSLFASFRLIQLPY